MAYKSNNPSIASVDSKGTVTGVAVGSTTIEQTSESGVLLKRGNVSVVSATAPAYVPTTGITLSQKSLTFYYSNRTSASGWPYATVKVMVYPNNATNKTIKYWLEKDGEVVEPCTLHLSSLNPSKQAGYTSLITLDQAMYKGFPTDTYTLVVQAADGQRATCPVKIVKDGSFVEEGTTTQRVEDNKAHVNPGIAVKVNYRVYDNYDDGLEYPVIVPGTKVTSSQWDYYLVKDATVEIPIYFPNLGGVRTTERVIRGKSQYTQIFPGHTVTLIQEGSTEILGFRYDAHDEHHGCGVTFSASGNYISGTSRITFGFGEGMLDTIMPNVTMDDWISFKRDPVDDGWQVGSVSWWDENGEFHNETPSLNQSGPCVVYGVPIQVTPNTSTEQRVGWVKFPNNKWFKVVQEGVEA